MNWMSLNFSVRERDWTVFSTSSSTTVQPAFLPLATKFEDQMDPCASRPAEARSIIPRALRGRKPANLDRKHIGQRL